MFFPRIDSSQCSGAACTLPLLSLIPPFACTCALYRRLCRTKAEGCSQSNIRPDQIQSGRLPTLSCSPRASAGDSRPLSISSERRLLLSSTPPCISASPPLILKVTHVELLPDSSISTFELKTEFFLRVTGTAEAGSLCSLTRSGTGFRSILFWLLWSQTCVLLWLSNADAGVGGRPGFRLPTVLRGRPGARVDSFSFTVTNALTRSTCF